jgi:hypothetical protein
MTTYSEWLELVRIGLATLDDVPIDMQDRVMSCAAVTKDGWALSVVPPECIDYDLCLQAVAKTGWMLKFVPIELRDYEMCKTAVAADILPCVALEFVPEDLHGREFLEILASAK